MADKKWEYIQHISKRGDDYGNRNGTLDLLLWCGKQNLMQVTEAEARQYWLDPSVAYSAMPAAAVADPDIP